MRITVGKRAYEGIVEYKLRREQDKSEKTIEQAVKDVIDLINEER